jgi:hypothetical protein
MAWWNNFGSKILDFFIPSRRLPDSKPKQRAQARAKATRGRQSLGPVTPRTLPKTPQEAVSRETPLAPSTPRYIDKLSQLRNEQQAKRGLEAIMFDPSRSRTERQAALQAWAEREGFWRPERNDTWSTEEWKRWEEIYESEPESF